ncbi:MAG: DUF2306 domain-containing protein [Acidobacteriota bacterium]
MIGRRASRGARRGASPGRLKKWLTRGAAALPALWILHTATQYFVMGIDRTPFMRHKVQTGFEPWAGWRPLLGAHVTAAVVALAAGGVAFALGERRRRWTVHRWAGRGYVVAVAVSGAAGLPLALTATGGAPAAVGFLVLNGVWLRTAAGTYWLARRRDVEGHRTWAVRSYAVTFANMTLHVLTALLTGPLGSRTAAYTAAVWLCWPINLAGAELYLRSSRRRAPPGDG